MTLTHKSLQRPKVAGAHETPDGSPTKVIRGRGNCAPRVPEGSTEHDPEVLAALSSLSATHLELVRELVNAYHRVATAPPVLRRRTFGSR